MGTVENVINLMNIDAFYQYLVRGAILLAAVLLDQLKNRGSRDDLITRSKSNRTMSSPANANERLANNVFARYLSSSTARC